MDDDTVEHSTIWSRLARLFGHSDEEALERAILDASADGALDPDEESMLLGILRFNDLKVSDTMIPRTDIECVPHDISITELAKIIVKSGHSRIPVYQDTRDNITGILHIKDLLSCLLEPRDEHITVSKVMREPFFVPETKSIRSLLQEFRSRKQHIAIALDEYGGTSGLITIEDVLEEIVGEIEDEHDAPRQEDIRSINANTYELTGRTPLEELAELGLKIDTDEVDTIGGYLCMKAGHVPETGETFTIGDWLITVLKADPKLVHFLRMEPADHIGVTHSAHE